MWIEAVVVWHLFFLQYMHGGDGDDGPKAGLEVDGWACDCVEFWLYFGTCFAVPNISLALAPIML